MHEKPSFTSETMRTTPRFSASLAFCVCLFLCAPVRPTSAGRIQQDAREDTLRIKSSRENVPKKGSTFRFLPKYYPDKDTAGFQLIPRQIVGDPVIARDIVIIPYDKAPQIVRKVDPTYPETAKRAGLEGKVVVEMGVDREGKVKQVGVLKSDADIFNKPASKAAKQFVFTPAYLHNEPVAAWLTYEFQFRLPKTR
jgi:TonB family protein